MTVYVNQLANNAVQFLNDSVPEQELTLQLHWALTACSHELKCSGRVTEEQLALQLAVR